MKDHSNVHGAVKLIGISDAQSILDGHQNFRRLSNLRKKTYARQMCENKWELSTLYFDENGALLDGQTRLQAIIASGIPQQFFCVHNWPRETEDKIDTGQGRTRGQVAGNKGIPSPSTAMSIVGGLVALDNEADYGVLTPVDALEIYESHHDAIDSVVPFLVKPIKAAIHGIAFVRAIILMPERKAEILSALQKLQALDFAEPRMNGFRLYFTLAITLDLSSGGRIQRTHLYLKCARALQAYLRNEYLAKLHMPNKDPFAGK